MQKIKKLPLSEIQKIAAGEVIERPANVVKELVENAIDAQATSIQIYIDQSGQQLIRVVDNGIGMNQEDAQLCFEHHATSKISSFDDLFNCRTFGFRGEALTSISAISKVTLITKDTNSTVGTKIIRDDNKNVLSQISAQKGTDIIIEELFYNVPARKKFLKSMQTESRQISLLFQAFCFAYPATHFTLYRDNQVIYNCPPVMETTDRIKQLWDKSIAQNIVPIKQTQNGITFEGIISNHQVYRYDRASIIFLVNNRWVKNSVLGKAVIKGYLNVLPRDRFPAAVIKIDINPAEIDINIHPRKEEILFRQSRSIEQQLTLLVSSNLENQMKPDQNHPSLFSFSDKPNSVFFEEKKEPYNLFSAVPAAPRFFSTNPIAHTQPQLSTFTESVVDSYRYLGSFALTYLLFENQEQLLLVDQHAAHERILYEQFKSYFGAVPIIELLFAQKISLIKTDLDQLIPYFDIIAQHGLILDQLNDQLLIRAAPVHLKECAFEELIKDILGIISHNQSLDQDEFVKILHEKIHAQMACKAAVKAGDQLSETKIKQLMHDLFKIQNRFVCPHGRPTSWAISHDEIEKKFKRNYK